MRLRAGILLAAIFAVVLAGLARGAVAPARTGKTTVTAAGWLVSLNNPKVRLTFDLQKGTYRAYRMPEATPFIVNAYAQAGTSSTLEGYKFTYTTSAFSDRLGTGCRLRLRGVRGAGPDLLVEFALYDRQEFLTVRAGVVNTTGRALRLKEFYPLRADFVHGGGVFAGPDPARDHRVLTGEGDTWCPRLLGRVNAKSANVILVTHLGRTAHHSLVMGGLTTFEFIHRVGVDYKPEAHLALAGRNAFDAWIRTWDAAGKEVEPGAEYLPDAAFVDFGEPNPYEALEQYARVVATAMNVRLNSYNTMTPVCMWYLSSTSDGDNTSEGALREARLMKGVGLAAYAPPLVRLVPTVPLNPNEQLWWDDEHWRKFGHLVAPTDTLRKWADQMKDQGAFCDLAIQPSVASADYAAAHPDQMLFNNARGLPDYTDPGLQKQLREACWRLKDAGIKGLFLDYCGTMLGIEGGFEDPGATAVSAYRKIFETVRAAAGPKFLVTENPNGRATMGAEAATGLIDAKRSEADKVTLTQRVIKRGIREWYRNKTTKLIDPDVKEFEPYDGDLLHAQVTAMATMFGKTMLGSSATRYTPEALRVIGRTLPLPLDGATARPLGLFNVPDDEDTGPNPETYRYPLEDGSYLLLLWNHSQPRAKVIQAALGGDTALGAAGLDEGLMYDLWDYWDWQDMGRMEGGATLAARVRGGEMKTVIAHPALRRPYVLATTRHLLPAQGAEAVRWDAGARMLRGRFHVIADVPFKALIRLPEGALWTVRTCRSDVPATRGVKLETRPDPLGKYVELCIDSQETRDVYCTLTFAVKKIEPTGLPGPPKALSGEVDAGESHIDLHWGASARLDDRPVRYLVYRDTREDFTPALKNRTQVTARTEAADGDIRPGETYYYQVVAEDAAGNRSHPARAQVKVAPGFARAVLNRVDTTTGGGWQGNYGKAGYVMFSVVDGNREKISLPSYMESLSYHGQKGTTLFTLSTADQRALTYSDDTTRTRRLGALAAFQDLGLELKLKDEEPHAVSLYFVNWEGLERRFSIEVLDAATRQPLAAPYELTDFRNGTYIQYIFRGSIVIKISRPESSNGVVLSGIFLDEAVPQAPAAKAAAFKTQRPLYGADGQTLFSWQPAPGAALYRLTVAADPGMKNPVYDDTGWETERQVPALAAGRTYSWKVEASGPKGSAGGAGGVQAFTAGPAAAFLGFDDATLGNWTAARGKAGYFLPAGNPKDNSDLKKLPDFIEAVDCRGSQYFNGINTGRKASPAAPEAPEGGERTGSAILDHWYLTVDIKARDAAEHTVSFYNWLGAIYPPDGVDEWIEVLDPETRQVLDRHLDRRMLDGPEGRYFSYRFSGRLLLRLRNENGPYCFLSGIFWEK